MGLDWWESRCFCFMCWNWGDDSWHIMFLEKEKLWDNRSFGRSSRLISFPLSEFRSTIHRGGKGNTSTCSSSWYDHRRMRNQQIDPVLLKSSNRQSLLSYWLGISRYGSLSTLQWRAILRLHYRNQPVWSGQISMRVAQRKCYCNSSSRHRNEVSQ